MFIVDEILALVIPVTAAPVPFDANPVMVLLDIFNVVAADVAGRVIPVTVLEVAVRFVIVFVDTLEFPANAPELIPIIGLLVPVHVLMVLPVIVFTPPGEASLLKMPFRVLAPNTLTVTFEKLLFVILMAAVAAGVPAVFIAVIRLPAWPLVNPVPMLLLLMVSEAGVA